MGKDKKHKMGIGLVAGFIAGVICLGIYLFLFVVKILVGKDTVITDVSRYQEAMTLYTENVEYHTGLMIFPECIPDSVTDIDFYCLDHTMLFGSSGEFLLQCTYEEAEYQAEIERLQNIYKQYGTVKRPILYDETNFHYPAYVAIDGHLGNYEYALLSGEKEITYVYVWGMNGENRHIKPEYLPLESENGKDNYSIYLIKKELLLDDVAAYSYDNTREYFVKVEQHHYEKIDFNLFYVNTYLNEQGGEMIQDCSFVYYKNKYDSTHGLPEEVVYEELAGYEFKSLKMNEEKTIAIVTYFDGEEEKNIEYEIPQV